LTAGSQTLSSTERRTLQRGTRLPLILVLVTLLIAVVLPRFTQRRVDRLRDEINNFADPARLRVTDIQLQLALQGSQRRGFLLSRDPALVQELQRSRERRVLAEHELLGYVRRLDANGGARLTSLVTRLAHADSALDSVVATGTDLSPTALNAQHDSFIGIQRLSDTLATKIDSVAESRRTAIGTTENLVALSIAGLLLLGLAAAFLVERLGARFRLLALRLDAAHEMSERRRSELERVTESRTRLVRGFTHDVKNPLGAADGYLSLLEDGVIGPLPERQRETVTRIRRSIRQALELIAQLLELARAEAGQLEIHPCPTDVGDEVRDVADAFIAQAEAKQLEIEVVVDAALPRVETDPARLRQVVGNLISNAVKYTPEHGHINVRTGFAVDGATRDEHEIRITVSDDGPGISKDKLPLLFTEFTRFDPNAAEGTGIGLAISKRIAQALGGDISLDTKSSRGACFVLHLPIQPR
jgi:signal transduction histidine kinase